MLLLTLLLDDYSSPADKSRAGLLFMKYHKSVYYTAMRILNNHSSAEDVVQKTFIRILKNMHKIDDIDSARTKSFILKIARNEALREYNISKKADIVSYEEYMTQEDYNANCNSDDVWQSYIEIHDRNKLKEVLKSLPEKYRTVIIYKYACGYSYKEIADILGITESNVSVLLTRAKQKLIKGYDTTNV